MHAHSLQRKSSGGMIRMNMGFHDSYNLVLGVPRKRRQTLRRSHAGAARGLVIVKHGIDDHGTLRLGIGDDESPS